MYSEVQDKKMPKPGELLVLSFQLRDVTHCRLCIPGELPITIKCARIEYGIAAKHVRCMVTHLK